MLDGDTRIATSAASLLCRIQSASCFKVSSPRRQSRHQETSRPHPHGVMFNAHRTGDLSCIWDY